MKDIRDLMNEFRAGHHEFEKGHLEGFEGADPTEWEDCYIQLNSDRAIEIKMIY